MLICPTSGFMASLTYSKTFHDFPPSISTKLGWRTFTIWSVYLSYQPPPSFFDPLLLPSHPIFKNAQLSTIHLLLLKMYSTKMIYEKSWKGDHPSDTFPVSYSVFHIPDPAYRSCLIIAFGRLCFSGGYIICFNRSWVSIQSVFFLSHTLYLPIPLYLNHIQVIFNTIHQNQDWSPSPGTLCLDSKWTLIST